MKIPLVIEINKKSLIMITAPDHETAISIFQIDMLAELCDQQEVSNKEILIMFYDIQERVSRASIEASEAYLKERPYDKDEPVWGYDR